MIVCDKCGNQNPLGRVFCGSCGNKLDLSHMTSDTLSDMAGSRRRVFSVAWLRFTPLLLLPILLMIFLAYWPDPAPIGKEGTRIGGQRVASSVRVMMNLTKGRALGRDFTEEDINGYFEFLKTKDLNLESVSVNAQEGFFQVRVVKPLKKIRIGSLVLEPKISYDLYCVPAGGAVRVSKCRMGHLGWLGPMKVSAIRSVYRSFAAQKEWAMFANLSEVQSQPGKIAVVLQKN